MARQLLLLDTAGADWRLDERTREIGRRGVSEARAILHLAAERAAADAEGRGRHRCASAA